MSDDPHRFIFRGEGLTNFIVGFERNDKKYVWRFRYPKENAETVDFTFRQILPNYNYLKYTIAPLFKLNLSDDVELVEISASIVGKITEELPELEEKLKLISRYERISVLEMPDYANQTLLKDQDVFCVELKPKQGHVTGLDEFKPFCTNCLLNILKCSVDKKFAKMYDYCPLRLFSGNFNEMKKCLMSLIINPHNNLRIYKNGQRIFSKEILLCEEELAKILCLKTVDDFMAVLIKILLFSRKAIEDNNLPTDSVLEQLLRVQKLDTCGPFQAAQLAEKFFDAYIINQRTNRYQIYDEIDNNFDIEQNLFRNCLVAATVKDCSIMIRFYKINAYHHREKLDSNIEDIVTDFGKFAFKINLIDLDAKKPENLIKYKNKLLKSFQLIKSMPNFIHPKCY